MRSVLWSFASVAILCSGRLGSAESLEHLMPRPAYVCAAILGAAPDPVDAKDLIKDVSSRQKQAADFVPANPYGKISAALGRLQSTLRFVRPKFFPVRQKIVGSARIREYLNLILENAHRMEQDHDPLAATRPFKIGYSKLISSLGWATAGVLIGASQLHLAVIETMAQSYDHLLFHASMATILFYGAQRDIFRGVWPQLINLRNVARAKQMPTAEVKDQTLPDFARAVLAQLDEAEPLRRRPIVAQTRALLPISRSSHGMFRRYEMLTAEQIRAAVKTSGEFAKPTDPRAVAVDLAYFPEYADGDQAELIVLAHETI